MGMRALAFGSVLLLAGIVACSSAGAATSVAAGSRAPRVTRSRATTSRSATSRSATSRSATSRSATSRSASAKAASAKAASAKAASAKAAAAKPAAARASTEATGEATATVTEGLCTGPADRKALAAQLSADIYQGLDGRDGSHAVAVYDRVTGVSCLYNGSAHYDSASIVKAIILAALLRWHQQTSTPLSSWEEGEATEMITESDNDSATDLWNELGMDNLQDFLNAAGMSETELGQDGEWGLTQVTAHDEMLLLKLLTAPNPVLDASSRTYQLGLMAKVVGWESWGVTAGTPSGVTWHLKNGWLPDATGWHVNSIGTFSGDGKDYMIAMLSDNDDTSDDDADDTEQYNINTIEDVSRLVQRDLNNAALTGSGSPAAAKLAAAANVASPQAQPSSWAVVPALPTPTQG